MARHHRLIVCAIIVVSLGHFGSAQGQCGYDSDCETLFNYLRSGLQEEQELVCKGGCACTFHSSSIQRMKCPSGSEFRQTLANSSPCLLAAIKMCTEELFVECDRHDSAGSSETLSVDGFLALKKFEVTGCRHITALTGQLPSTIRQLSIRNNSISQLPAQWFIDLNDGPAKVDLSHNKLKMVSKDTFPNELPEQVKVLDLSYNSMTVLDPTGLSAPGLHELILDFNNFEARLRLCEIGKQMAPDLHKLHVSHAGVTELTDLSGCHALSGVTELYLFFNTFRHGEIPDLASLSSLTELKAQRCSLKTVTPTKLPTSLEKLYIGGNNLKSLEQALLSRLPKLTFLSAAMNDIESPTEQLSSPSLQSLFLHFNRIAHTKTRWNFPKLKTMDLSHNRIKRVDEQAFQGLPKLKELSFASNAIEDLPSPRKLTTSGILTQLSFIDMSDNRLSAVEEMRAYAKQREIFPGKHSEQTYVDSYGLDDTVVVDLTGNPAECFSVVYYGFECEECYEVECKCSSGFEKLDNKCVTTKSYWITMGIIAGMVSMLFLVLAFFVVKYWRTKRRLGYASLQRDAATQELIEYKKAWEISPDEVEVGIPIDSDSPGQFGDVFAGFYREFKVAVKFIKSKYLIHGDEFMRAELMASFEKEVDFMSKCRHTNIVYFFGAGYKEGIPFLVTKFMSNGSLHKYIKDHQGDIDWQQKFQFVLDIAHGLQFIHSFGRVHRDIKAANVLVDDDLSCKISDFGSIKTLVKAAAQKGKRLGRRGIWTFVRGNTSESDDASGLSTVQGDASGQVGTPWYMAPEMLEAQPAVSPAADVWSYGVVVWEVCAERQPDIVQEAGKKAGGPTLTVIKNLLESGERLPISDWPEAFCSAMRMCWEHNATDRPSMAHLITQLNASNETSPKPNKPSDGEN